MKTTVTFSDFRQAFKAIRPDNFSHEGLEQLWDYFESYERDTGEEIELDVIAICCEYSEQTWQAIASDYGIDIDENENEEEQAQQVMNYLCDSTSVMGSSTSGGKIIYQNF
jgi:hypothetical protein